MAVIGGVVGFQEGMEAGLVTGGLANSERHTSRAIAIGLGSTAIGVALGSALGEDALRLVDKFVGDGGIGFLPAIAIGTSVSWHNIRERSPQQATRKLIKGFPYILGAAFAAFEGVESGILTSSLNTGLFTAEAVTLGTSAVTVATFGGLKLFAEKVSPKKALRAARAIALLPALYLGGKATPELINNPKPVGVGIATLGALALGTSIKSFFKKSS
jgi:hypothetical protein